MNRFIAVVMSLLLMPAVCLAEEPEAQCKTYLVGAGVISLAMLALAVLATVVFAISLPFVRHASYKLFYAYILLFAVPMVLHIRWWIFIVADLSHMEDLAIGLSLIDVLIIIVNVFMLRSYRRKIVASV